MLTGVAETYSEVFAPELFVLLCSVLLIGYEWRGASDRSRGHLAVKLLVLTGAWIVAFAIYQGLPRLFGPLPTWGPDATGSLGLAAGMGVLWVAWHLQEWGDELPKFAAVLIAVTVPHLLITPFWDISSHVLYTMVPAGSLVLVERRFAPVLMVPVGMIAARPLANAHTWAQSIGGGALAAVFLYGLYRTRSAATRQPNPA